MAATAAGRRRAATPGAAAKRRSAGPRAAAGQGRQGTRRTAWAKARASADGGGSLPPPDVEKLAKMASIAVSKEEAEEWTPKVEKAIEFLGQLLKVDVDGVEPTAAVAFGENEGCDARDDTPRRTEGDARDALVAAFPKGADGQLQVPFIAAGEQQ